MTGAARADAARLLAAGALYTAFFTLFFAPALLAGRTLAPGDGFLQYLPAHAQPYAPWVEEIAAGYPAFADPQFFLHYPLKWLLRSYDAFVIAAVVLAATWTFGWVRARTESTLAAAVAGLVFASGSFMTRHLGHTSIIHAAAWLPLILWAGDAALGRARIGRVLALAFGVAMAFAAGHPQIAVYAFLASGAQVLWRVAGVARRGAWRSAVRRAAAVAGGWALGGALAAATLLPLVGAGAASARGAAWGYGDFTSYAMPLRQWATIAFPGLYGGPASGTPYFGAFNVGETIAFAGLGVWVLALLGLWSRRRQDAAFWALLIAGAWTLVTVGDQPLGRLLYQVPLLGDFRAHGRAALLLILAAAVSAGDGIAYLRRGGRGVRAAGLATFAVAATALASTLNDPHWRALTAAQGLDALRFAGANVVGPLLTLAATSVAALALRHRPGRMAAVALFSIVAVDVGQFGARAEWRGGPNAPPPEAWRDLAQEISASGGRLMPLGPLDARENPLVPNANLLLGAPSTAVYGPLLDATYERATGMNGAGAIPGIPSDALLDLLAVSHLTLSRSAAWSGSAGACSAPSDAVAIDFALPRPLAVAAVRVRSHLACSVEVADGAAVATFDLFDGGTETSVALLAGRDTSEWAHDRADVQPRVAHARAPIAASFAAGDFFGHWYQADLPLSGAEIEGGRLTLTPPVGAVTAIDRIEFLGADGRVLHTLALIDVERTGIAFAPFTERVAVARRGPVAGAWFVPSVAVADVDAAADAVRTGRLADGTRFDPRRVALVPPGTPAGARGEGEVLGLDAGAEGVRVEVGSEGGGFLVLSRSYHPGWRATIDGERVDVVRTNAIATGIAIPPGRHEVRLTFAPNDLRAGRAIAVTALTVALALAAVAALSASAAGRARRASRRLGS